MLAASIEKEYKRLVSLIETGIHFSSSSHTSTLNTGSTGKRESLSRTCFAYNRKGVTSKDPFGKYDFVEPSDLALLADFLVWWPGLKSRTHIFGNRIRLRKRTGTDKTYYLSSRLR